MINLAQPAAFYPVFMGTVLSIISLSYLARREYIAGEAKTLSRLGGGHSRALWQFRAILWVCGSLFAITLLLFVAPRLHSPLMFVVLAITCLFEILLGVVPDHPGKKHLWHCLFAYGMAVGFFIAAAYFAIYLKGSYQLLSLITLLGMLTAVGTAGFDRKRFLFYELGFIYLSHIGIVVAALALR